MYRPLRSISKFVYAKLYLSLLTNSHVKGHLSGIWVGAVQQPESRGRSL